jgi:queuine tRNA-ribosyltransferase
MKNQVIERAPKEIPPIFQMPIEHNQSRLRRFTGHDDDTTLILGLRRIPPVESPNPNSNSEIAISTSVGFTTYAVKDYIAAAQTLKPDILICPGDITFVPLKPSQKRVEKAADRTTLWMKEVLLLKQECENDEEKLSSHIFAPIIPVAWEQQKWYTELLAGEEFRFLVNGLSVYDVQAFQNPPEAFSNLPRLSLTQPCSPNEVLRQIWLGMDLLVIPFIDAATDAGIALDFSFPTPSFIGDIKSHTLGIDFWDTSHSNDLSPLREGCQCYACKKHHRAFLHHLLHAKEMLGWVLLQVHNHHVMDEFFAGIRKSIANGSLEQDMKDFDRYYERDLPDKTGQGPRYVSFSRH